MRRVCEALGEVVREQHALALPAGELPVGAAREGVRAEARERFVREAALRAPEEGTRAAQRLAARERDFPRGGGEVALDGVLLGEVADVARTSKEIPRATAREP